MEFPLAIFLSILVISAACAFWIWNHYQHHGLRNEVEEKLSKLESNQTEAIQKFRLELDGVKNNLTSLKVRTF
jgi:fatty acid desaturase